MENIKRIVSNLFILSLVTMMSGCATYWGKVPYNPPSDTEKNIAHVRLIGNPPGFTISQYGNKPGAVDPWICPYISRHLLSLNPLLACCRRYSRGER